MITFGLPGVKRDDPDWFPAFLLNHIFGGGGFSSRLTAEIREKRGLTYGIYTSLWPLDHAALLVGGGSTVNDKAGETLGLIKSELVRMAEGGVSEEELADAKTYLTGSLPLQFTSTSATARIILQVQRDRLGIDYLQRRTALIEAVTVADVNRMAKRLLDPAKLTTVVVGQPKGITPSRMVE
ncbi:hypothetical protein WCLP8_440007 [uncultured Gammaproteobacteria bacterium]